MHRRVISTTLGALLVGSGLLAGSEQAIAAQPSAGSTAVSAAPKYQDYLAQAPSGASLQVAGSGADQCAKPLGSRSGTWLCFESGGAGSAAASASGQNVAASTGFCNSSGCYTRVNDFSAYFTANSGTWGYGTTVLGRETHSVDWKVQGGQTTSKPVQYINSVSTTNVVFSGDLLDAGVGQQGSEVAGTFSLYNAGTVVGGRPRTWDPNGYKSYDTARGCHTAVHQFSWNYGSYPGYWYSYVKSIPACKSGGSWRFGAVSGLPASPYGGGYRN